MLFPKEVTGKEVRKPGCISGTASRPQILRKLHSLTVCGLAASSLTFFRALCCQLLILTTHYCFPDCSKIPSAETLIWNRSHKSNHLAFFSVFFLWVHVSYTLLIHCASWMVGQEDFEVFFPTLTILWLRVRWTSNNQEWNNQHSCLQKLLRFPLLTGYSLQCRAWQLGQKRGSIQDPGSSDQERAWAKIEDFRPEGSFLSKLLRGSALGDVMIIYLCHSKSGRRSGHWIR